MCSMKHAQKLCFSRQKWCQFLCDKMAAGRNRSLGDSLSSLSDSEPDDFPSCINDTNLQATNENI